MTQQVQVPNNILETISHLFTKRNSIVTVNTKRSRTNIVIIITSLRAGFINRNQNLPGGEAELSVFLDHTP